MKQIISLLTIIAFSTTINAQLVELAWANQIGGTGLEYSTDILVDEDGNTYLAGNFSGTVDFDAGIGVAELTALTGNNIFILKQNPTGELIWIKQVAGTYQERVSHIALDNENNIIINGTFRGTVDFDPSDDEFLITSTELETDLSELHDFFLLKLNTNGDFIWVKNYTPTSEDYPIASYFEDIFCDNMNNIYVSILLENPMNIGTEDAPNILTPFLETEQEDAVILKLNSSGDLIWSNQLLGKIAGPIELNVDEDNNLYIYSAFFNSIDVDAGSGVYLLEDESMDSYSQAFIAKYTPEGEIIWGKAYQGEGVSYINSFAITENNIVLLGEFYDQTDFDLGAGEAFITPTEIDYSDIFIQKLDLNGEYIWAKSIGSVNNDFASCINVDANNDIYLTGNFDGEMDINPDDEELILSSIDVRTGFILKLNENGSLIWHGQYIASTLADYPLSIAIANTEEIFVSSYFTETIDVDPEATTTSFTSAGSLDIFITKLNTSALLGIREFSDSKIQASIYPNPFSDYTVVHLEQNTNKNQRIVISDVLGNIVVEKTVTSQNMVIEKDEMRAGIYLLSIVDMEENEVIYNGKLVVQ